tara:strand:- start:136 stop:498 length:363 start_codon:yes stop_codon:yes gene_type:complete
MLPHQKQLSLLVQMFRFGFGVKTTVIAHGFFHSGDRPVWFNNAIIRGVWIELDGLPQDKRLIPVFPVARISVPCPYTCSMRPESRAEIAVTVGCSVTAMPLLFTLVAKCQLLLHCGPYLG